MIHAIILIVLIGAYVLDWFGFDTDLDNRGGQ